MRSIVSLLGTLRAFRFKRGCENLYRLFENFIQLLEQTGDGFDESYLEQDNSPVFNAYWKWMNEKDAEISAIPPKPIIPIEPQAQE